MWIWLESQGSLTHPAIFLTHSSDPKSASSQPVYDESPVSITVYTISEASTGIGYYCCIYIDISLYILRRSKRQAFHRKSLVVRIAGFISNRQSILCEKMRGEPDQALVLWSVLKSGPFMVRTRHMSCRRERMRSVMRSPRVSSREAERASSSSRDFFSREISFSALPEGPSGKLVVMMVVFCSL